MNVLPENESIDDAIDLLRRVIRSEQCARLSKSTIVGFLGEVLVKKMLRAEGKDVDHKGNQSGIDLEYKSNGQSIKIDVKTSTRKQEFLKNVDGFTHWGWAMKKKEENKAPSHFVCVGLDVEYQVESVFVVPHQCLDNLAIAENDRMGQFKKVTHGLLLPCADLLEPESEAASQKGPVRHMDKCRQLLGNGISRVTQDGRLSELLESRPSR